MTQSHQQAVFGALCHTHFCIFVCFQNSARKLFCLLGCWYDFSFLLSASGIRVSKWWPFLYLELCLAESWQLFRFQSHCHWTPLTSQTQNPLPKSDGRIVTPLKFLVLRRIHKQPWAAAHRRKTPKLQSWAIFSKSTALSTSSLSSVSFVKVQTSSLVFSFHLSIDLCCI